MHWYGHGPMNRGGLHHGRDTSSTMFYIAGGLVLVYLLTR